MATHIALTIKVFMLLVKTKIEVFHVKCILDKPVDLYFTGFIAINSKYY